jgi:hypothetical protein
MALPLDRRSCTLWRHAVVEHTGVGRGVRRVNRAAAGGEHVLLFVDA